MALSSKLTHEFDDYSLYHRVRGNKITHYIGIPLILVSILGLLSSITIAGSLNAGILLCALAASYYLYLDWKIAIGFSLVLVASYFISHLFSSSILWGAFILGWILQFIGHGVYEKKSPAFFRNGRHLLVGPLWVFCNLIGKTNAQQGASLAQ